MTCLIVSEFVILGDHLVLDKELFVEIKPGLSSYADNPEKVINNLIKRLAKCRHMVSCKRYDRAAKCELQNKPK